LPDDATALLDLYDRLHELTDGALDPLIGRAHELLGYNATYSLTPASDAVREIEHPFDPARIVGVVVLRGNALCASAVNRRAWGDGLHHIIDARTATPVHDVLATWVIADNATLADGIATALFLTDSPRLNDTYRFAFVRMSTNGIEASPGFDGELFV
jgi:thiamine biosynthesis lipoprotein ApbE